MGVSKSAASYTEDLANVLREVADRVKSPRDPEVTAFLNRLNESVVAGEPVTLWGVEYVPAQPRTVDDVKRDVRDAIAGGGYDRVDDLVQEAYEIGVSEAFR